MEPHCVSKVTAKEVGHAGVGIREPSAGSDGITLPSEANICP